MDAETPAQLSAYSVFLGSLATIIVGGAGFVIKRWITGAKHDEHLARGLKVAELISRMKETGLSGSDFEKWGISIQMPQQGTSLDDGGDANAGDTMQGSPLAFQNNVAMKVRAGAEYGVATALMNQALVDLDLLLRPDERDAFETGQKHWETYRDALAEVARQEFAGGSHAPLAAVWAALTETKRRTGEIRNKIEEIIIRSN